ncbi:MAG TPA: mycothiol system anti-sigma-R factor [Acidimicrobiales bacterium]|nr:mycothiol system anti-sigma-R factor [Acidimicrobiales bacterium]
MPEPTEPTSECRDALHELYGYLDGELTEERRAAIDRHLDGCQPCAEPYDFEAELRAVVRRKCQEKVPQSLVLKVRAALAEEQARRR